MSLTSPPPTAAAPACAGCGATATRPRLEVRGGAYLECTGCGLLRTAPFPDEQELEARAEYWSERHHLQTDKLQRQFDPALQALAYGKVLRALAPYRRGGRLLEVGCAAGAFLDAAQRDGWRPTGVELSHSAARYAREQRDLDVRAGTVTTVEPFADGEFDAVVMLDVIEHVFDPAALLAGLRQWIAPGGALLVMTPNTAGLGARWLGAEWEAYTPADHLWLFDRRTLESVCHDAGYAVRSTWTMDCNPAALARSLRSRRPASAPSGAMTEATTEAPSEATTDTSAQPAASAAIHRRNRLIRSLSSSRLLRGARAAVNLALGATGLGDKLYVLAERAS